VPELAWNIAHWDGGYDWIGGGEEWSEVWGGSESQWFGSLYPRLRRSLPARAILEIAPGFGRWTKFLLNLCRDYVGIDLSGECVAACRDRFRTAMHARFEQNDGLSLAAASDNQFDFVFTFDSLVHAESDVMTNYVPQILRKLTSSGVAFVHHSNMAALAPEAENKHGRGRSVSAETMAATIARAGGKVLVQERINWGAAHLTDCLSLFARQEYPGETPTTHIENARFMEEADIIRNTHAPWARHRPAAARSPAL
jgi:cyclopropane fatty-acyl-phospholipid synthase-like methyltransferase